MHKIKAHVIAVESIKESMEAAGRCVESAQTHGIEASIWPACTPEEARDVFKRNSWPTDKFDNNPYSRPLPCMACFASHAFLWQHIAEAGEPAIICEHDCFFVAPLPKSGLELAWAVNLGKPSYGEPATPPDGLSPMRHNPHPHYMGGAHCYFVRPQAAERFLKASVRFAEPTDMYLNLERFVFMMDWHPWIAECRDEVTTIQLPLGCEPKHNKVRII